MPEVVPGAPPGAGRSSIGILVDDYKTREKELYAILSLEGLIHLVQESTKEGMGEFYEDALDDMLTNLPSYEFVNHNYRPHPALLEMMTFWRERLLNMGFQDIPEWSKTGDDGNSGVTTYLDLYRWLEALRPYDWNIDKADPKAGAMNRYRAIGKKRVMIDLLDDMQILRMRVPMGSQPESAFDKVKGWKRPPKKKEPKPEAEEDIDGEPVPTEDELEDIPPDSSSTPDEGDLFKGLTDEG